MLISRIWRNIFQCTLVCTSDSVETYVIRIIKSPGWQIYLPPSSPLAQGVLYNKELYNMENLLMLYYTTLRLENLLRVYYITTMKTYSGFTLQHRKPAQGILLQHGKPTLDLLYNMENLLRVYYKTLRLKIYSGYTIQHGEPAQGIQCNKYTQSIFYNKENLLRVYFTT